MLRRVTIILVTALIVARPLVLGENPGMESDPFDTSNLMLTMMWLVAAAMWGLWRLWARQTVWYGGTVEACLFAVVLLTCGAAAFVAPYKHPARLIAWEWVALGLAFVLLRQLAVTPDERRCFFAVLLAGAVPLSAFALYQRGYEIPKMQARYEKDPELLREDYAKDHGGLVPDDAFLAVLRRRVEDSHAYGTFAHPNSFAGYLVLLVPGLVGTAMLCARHRHPQWQVGLAACFATLGVVAVGLTHSRGALLGLAAAGLGTAAVLWRGWLRRKWPYALGGAAALALVGLVVWKTELWTAGLGKSQGTAAVRLEYWRNTWSMIRQHAWLGVGPGQFGRYYPRYMHETDGETIKDPHNFALEIWATCGAFALLALLAALALFYRKVFRCVLSAPTVDGPGDVPPEPAAAEAPVRWEFYVGGMLGLLLAFGLRVADKSPDAIKIEAITSGVLSVFWFAAYGLFEQVKWSDRARALALAAGVSATLLNLLVSGGINFAAVALPLWCAVALALNSADLTPNAWVGRFKPLLYVPLPVLAGLAVAYLTNVFYPVVDCVTLMKSTTEKRQNLANQAGPPPFAGAARTIFGPAMTEPLEKALREEDPGYARLCLYLAEFYADIWRPSATARQRVNLDEPNALVQKALDKAARAQYLDPEGRDGYLVEYQLRRRFAWGWDMRDAPPTALGLGGRMAQAELMKTRPDYELLMDRRREQYRLAADAIRKVIDRDPFNANWHYQLAETLYLAGDDADADREAGIAARLHDNNAWPTRRLTNEHRAQIDRWLPPTSER
jgi:hypothetical protein